MQFSFTLLVMTVEFVMSMGKSFCECCRSVSVLRDRNYIGEAVFRFTLPFIRVFVSFLFVHTSSRYVE